MNCPFHVLVFKGQRKKVPCWANPYFTGKWDAGMATPQHTPWGRGYEQFFGCFRARGPTLTWNTMDTSVFPKPLAEAWVVFALRECERETCGFLALPLAPRPLGKVGPRSRWGREDLGLA